MVGRETPIASKMENLNMCYLQYGAVLKGICTGSSFESTEGYVTTSERRNITELGCTQGFRLVRFADKRIIFQTESVSAGCTVILIWNPITFHTCSLEDCKTFRSTCMKF